MKLTIDRNAIYNLVFISFCIYIFLFGGSFPVKFSNTKLEDLFYFALLFGFLISIIWTVNRIFRIKTCVFTISAIVVAIPVFLIALLSSSMCSYSDEIIFSNRNGNKVIVARSYGCGAYDSDFPQYKIYEKTLFLNVFNVYKSVDTATLDKSKWKAAN
jgi:hypothetical protein